MWHLRGVAGDKQFKAAERLSKGSLLALRLKADWEQATPLYEQAAHNFKVRLHCRGFSCTLLLRAATTIFRMQMLQAWYAATRVVCRPDSSRCSRADGVDRVFTSVLRGCLQQSKVYGKAIVACEKAAQGHERLNSPWHAAKHLEKAADCCKVRPSRPIASSRISNTSAAFLPCAHARADGAVRRGCQELGQVQDVAGWVIRAADCYEEAGRQQPAAEALSRGARIIEESQPAVSAPTPPPPGARDPAKHTSLSAPPLLPVHRVALAPE